MTCSTQHLALFTAQIVTLTHAGKGECCWSVLYDYNWKECTALKSVDVSNSIALPADPVHRKTSREPLLPSATPVRESCCTEGFWACVVVYCDLQSTVSAPASPDCSLKKDLPRFKCYGRVGIDWVFPHRPPERIIRSKRWYQPLIMLAGLSSLHGYAPRRSQR